MRDRKPHVRVAQEQIHTWVASRGVATVSEVAEEFGISTATARRKLDGLAYQGLLAADDHDDRGAPLHHLDYRYCEVV